MAEFTGGTIKADHLVVLAHGLWGNPSHMTQVAKALRSKHSADKVHILCPRRNAGSFTYDGVELGGERVCAEIEEELKTIKSRGGSVKKISFVGYSQGGLVARYAIGLLYSKGILQDLECMNYTAFASPFIGVRAPLKGWISTLYNEIGSRTLSLSGRQLFTIDSFHDTGRPLFAIMADRGSIFMKGLALFKRRTLYANITNDRTVPFYTGFISKTDPYTDLDKIKTNAVEGYDGVILNREKPWAPIGSEDQKPPPTTGDVVNKWMSRVPFFAAFSIFLPVGLCVYLASSAYNSVRSSRRIALHQKTKAESGPVDFFHEIRGAVEDAYEGLQGGGGGGNGQQYLADGETSSGTVTPTSSADEAEKTEREKSLLRVAAAADTTASDASERAGSATSTAIARTTTPRRILALERKMSSPGEPTLALAACQFEMIQGLHSLNWRKYPVHLQKDRHSHAGIVVRWDKASFSEGKIVFRHWLDEEFLV